MRLTQQLAAAVVVAAALATPALADRDDHHRDWKMDQPIVSGYAPAKGLPGDTITINGRNFGHDAVVLWGGAPVAGASVTSGAITFTVPKGAASGELAVREGGHEWPVGHFDVAKYDRNDWKKHDDDRHKAAEDAWSQRSKTIAKDKAARDAELAKQEKALEESREQRRKQEETELRAKWDREFLADSATVAELALHSQRNAELERMQRLAADRNDSKLGVRVEVLVRRENDRHDQRMAALKAAYKGK